MKKSLVSFFSIILLTASFFYSCDNDDNRFPTPEPPRDRGPQAITDDEILVEFLKTHTYNDKDFAVTDHTLSDVDIKIFNKLEETETSTGKAIFESDKLKTVELEFGGIKQNLYVLKIRKGEGKVITDIDPVHLTYNGNVIDGNSDISTNFDSQKQPVWLPNIRNIVGFATGTSQFKTATVPNESRPCDTFFTDPGTGEVKTNNDFGIGIIFIPSGLGYYAAAQNDIPAYSNLMFTFSTYNTEYQDLDGDGILSIDEDLNNNEDLSDDDTDGDGIQNFRDADDDGDGISTREEIIIKDKDDTVDSDCDGILNNDSDAIFLYDGKELSEEESKGKTPDHLTK